MTITTGALAATAGITPKAVRLYLERGLLEAERTSNGTRLFDEASVARVRRIAAMRRIDLSLGQIAAVLDAPDSVAAFDEVWSARRRRFGELLDRGERARDLLLDASARSAGPQATEEFTVRYRRSGRHLRLSLEVLASLDELPREIPAATNALFESLHRASAPLAGPPYVEYPERLTEGFRGRIRVHAPVDAVLAPRGRETLSLREECEEAVIELAGDRAYDRGVVVAAHDRLSRSRFDPRLRPASDTREVYSPGFGDPAVAGTVLEICVPVVPRTLEG